MDTGVVPPEPTLEERLTVAVEHLRHNLEYKGERYGILEFRKFWGGYLKGLPLASVVRRDLVVAPDIETVEERLLRYRQEVEEFEREQEERQAAYLEGQAG